MGRGGHGCRHQARKISSREAVEATFQRLHEVNPPINAIAEIFEEEALAAADRPMRRWPGRGMRSAARRTNYDQVNVDLAGHPTTHGLVAFKDAIAAEDSSPVANLRKAGAVIVGRTNVPAFSYRWFTGNDLHGITRNPWNLKLTPGGSSGGAAAATAVGIGTLSHGNDVAGSLRLPASACGIYGMRPTTGRLPTHNPSQPGERSLCLQVGATEGVLARSVRDLRLGLAALERPDYRDPWQVPAPSPRADDGLPCRVAYFTGEEKFGTIPEVGAIVRKASAWLQEAGYIVEEAEPPALAEISELWMAMLYAECTGPVRDFMLNAGDEAFRQSFHNTAANFPVLDAFAFHGAWQRRLAIQRQWAAFLDKYPVLLMPNSFQPTFPIDHDLAGKDEVAKIAKAFIPTISVAGVALPGVSVPVGTAAGTPAGVQVVCGQFRDERCLSAAATLEERIGKVLPIDPIGA